MFSGDHRVMLMFTVDHSVMLVSSADHGVFRADHRVMLAVITA